MSLVESWSLNQTTTVEVAHPGVQGVPGAVSSVNGRPGAVVLTSADVGLANVDNTADASKPVSTAQAAADTAVATAASNALAAHVAAADPHTGYALESSLAAVATSGAYADLTGKPTLGTAAPLNVAASGDAASGEVVKGNDSRLTDARTPTTHTHTASQISDSTTAGRAVLTAADAAAQRTALGVPAGSGNSTGTNTGDQTNITGNAGSATALQTARNINGVAFDGTANITINAVDSTARVAKAGDTMTGALNWAATQTIASAATTDIGAATSNSVIVSGTKTITGLGTIAAGAERVVQFSGALTLTHNETSLILPGGASITTAAGDVAYFVSLGSGNWRCTGYSFASGQKVTGNLVVAQTAGVNSTKQFTMSHDGTTINLVNNNSDASGLNDIFSVSGLEIGGGSTSTFGFDNAGRFFSSSVHLRIAPIGISTLSVNTNYMAACVRDDGCFAFSLSPNPSDTPDTRLYRGMAGRIDVCTTDNSTYGDLKLRSLISSGGTITLSNYTVATLPTAASNTHAIVAVTDGNASPTYRGAVTGGGSTKGVVYCDGSSWMWH